MALYSIGGIEGSGGFGLPQDFPALQVEGPHFAVQAGAEGQLGCGGDGGGQAVIERAAVLFLQVYFLSHAHILQAYHRFIGLLDKTAALDDLLPVDFAVIQVQSMYSRLGHISRTIPLRV